MLDIFSGLRLVIKRRHTSIDNAIFRCHWFLTSTILISFSVIITARQYVGQPIECHSSDKIPDSLLNSYCWVQSTFTIPSACSTSKRTLGVDIPYPCIDNSRGNLTDIKVFAYYQWVGIVLFVQGVLFHLPYYLWKVWESGLIKAITGGLRVAVCSESERRKKRDIVIEYIYEHLGCHKKYAVKYFVCELCCLLNLALQLWATNKFFDGQFLLYGLDVLQYSAALSNSYLTTTTTLTKTSLISTNLNNNNKQQQQYSSTSNTNNNNNATYFVQQQHQQQFNQHNIKQQFDNNNQQQQLVDPMTYIFPRMTKCSYYDFGSSGDVQKHDALCLLPLNIVNEKIYIALWFWFLILAMLTILVIMYRLCAFASSSVRCKGLASRCKFSPRREITIICAACDVGDWFLLYMVAENVDPLIMREIVSAVAFRIEFDVAKDECKAALERQATASYSLHADKQQQNTTTRNSINNSNNDNNNSISNNNCNSNSISVGQSQQVDNASSSNAIKQPCIAHSDNCSPSSFAQCDSVKLDLQRLLNEQPNLNYARRSSYVNDVVARTTPLSPPPPATSARKFRKRLYSQRLLSADLSSLAATVVAQHQHQQQHQQHELQATLSTTSLQATTTALPTTTTTTTTTAIDTQSLVDDCSPLVSPMHASAPLAVDLTQNSPTPSSSSASVSPLMQRNHSLHQRRRCSLTQINSSVDESLQQQQASNRLLALPMLSQTNSALLQRRQRFQRCIATSQTSAHSTTLPTSTSSSSTSSGVGSLESERVD